MWSISALLNLRVRFPPPPLFINIIREIASSLQRISPSKFAVNWSRPVDVAAFRKRRSLRRVESQKAPLTKSEGATLLTWEMIRRRLDLRRRGWPHEQIGDFEEA